MLNEIKEKELKGIVQRMIDGDESEENIGSVIQRFHEINVDPDVISKGKASTIDNSLLGKLSGGIGKVMDPASEFLFGKTSKTVGSLLAAPILTLKGEGKKAETLTKESITPANIALTALELYPGGGAVSKALKAMPGGAALADSFLKIPEALRSSAIKQYSEALGATTEKLKVKTAKVVPELIKRKITGGVETIKDIASLGVEKAGEAVAKAEDTLPVFRKQSTRPLIEKALKLKESFIINGKVIDETATKAINNVVRSISQYGKNIPETSLVKIRRVLDKSIEIANKDFTKSEGLSLAVEAKQGIANSIRTVLNSNNPKLAIANKEFNLWKDVENITAATIKRRSTQGAGLTRFIVPAIGAGAGFSAGIPGGILGYFATQQAIKLFTSPLYKTVAAVNKSKLANLLETGKIKEATLLTAKMLNSISNINGKKQTYEQDESDE